MEYEGGRRGRSNIFAAQITGEPAWLQSDRFNIDAITDDPVCQATMLGPMLRALLEDRFKLKIREETREAPIYELTVAKNGPKLKRFDDSCTNPEDFTKTPQYPPLPKSPTDCRNSSGGARCHCIADWRGISIDSLIAASLDPVNGRSVVNKTGLSGLFDIHLEYAPDANSDAPDAAPAIFDALQQQLGLKLVEARGSAEALFVDRVEKPSEN